MTFKPATTESVRGVLLAVIFGVASGLTWVAARADCSGVALTLDEPRVERISGSGSLMEQQQYWCAPEAILDSRGGPYSLEFQCADDSFVQFEVARQ